MHNDFPKRSYNNISKALVRLLDSKSNRGPNEYEVKLLKRQASEAKRAQVTAEE